jgi:hypothetical protein
LAADCDGEQPEPGERDGGQYQQVLPEHGEEAEQRPLDQQQLQHVYRAEVPGAPAGRERRRLGTGPLGRGLDADACDGPHRSRRLGRHASYPSFADHPTQS